VFLAKEIASLHMLSGVRQSGKASAQNDDPFHAPPPRRSL
jgi:hypothetical protein